MHTHRGQSRPTTGHRAEIEQFCRDLFATKKRPAPPATPRPTRPFNPANPEEISTEEFLRQLFARDQDEALQAPPAPAAQASAQFQEMSTEDFFRELFARHEKPLALGPRPGLEPPALPARFSRVRGGNHLVSYELLVGEDGRIAAKHENVAGSGSYCIYEYDEAGHLLRAWRDGRLAEEYACGPRGARIASWNARDGQWKYGYDQGGRLTEAGPWRFTYAEDGSLREAWTQRMAFRLAYNQAGGLCRMVLPGGRVLRSETMAPGLPIEKYLDAAPVESFTWRSPLQLATYRDHQRGVRMRFHNIGSERLPQAVTVQDVGGSTTYLLGYDQVGSLKAVAAMDGPNEGRVVKTMDYDAFGNVLSDSNPALFLPLAFAGGLRDRFTGLVRFCHRDYDPRVGRFTAPDPLGDTGGDHDLYDYCVDEPVGRIDPEGLDETNWLSGVGQWFSDKWQATKDWWNKSPQPNQKDVIVGAADAAAKAGTVATETADALQHAGGHVDSEVVNVLKTPAGQDALTVFKSGAKVAAAASTTLDARDAIANMNQQDIDMAKLNAMAKQSVDPNSDAWMFLDDHGTDRGSMFRAAGSVGKMGVDLMVKP